MTKGGGNYLNVYIKDSLVRVFIGYLHNIKYCHDNSIFSGGKGYHFTFIGSYSKIKFKSKIILNNSAIIGSILQLIYINSQNLLGLTCCFA